MKNLTLLLVASAFVVGCSTENATIYGRRDLAQPAPTTSRDGVKAQPPAPMAEMMVFGDQEFEFNPQVDILFITDNSESMKSAQENLSRNIDKFVNEFKKNESIDYHIGVISVWDSSERFKVQKKDAYQIGELRHIKDPAGKTRDARFVSRSLPSSEKYLSNTLKLGVAKYADGGPENEEMFSALSASLKDRNNEGFFRKESQLVVVVVSDADDSTKAPFSPIEITPEQMARELIDFKDQKKDKVSVYGALVKKSDPDEKKDYALKVMPEYHPECFNWVTLKGKDVAKGRNDNSECSKGFGPDRLESLILNANSGDQDSIRKNHLMNLIQADFGKDLSRIGSDIAVKVLGKVIALPQIPAQTPKGWAIEVRYGTREELKDRKGGVVIPLNQQSGWVYDRDNNQVKISPNVKYSYKKGAGFGVFFTPERTGTQPVAPKK